MPVSVMAALWWFAVWSEVKEEDWAQPGPGDMNATQRTTTAPMQSKPQYTSRRNRPCSISRSTPSWPTAAISAASTPEAMPTRLPQT